MKGKKHTEETKAKISEKMIGNDNAEKWNEETVLPILEELESILFLDTDFEFITIASLLHSKKLYVDIWSEWTKKFQNSETVYLSIKRIESILEDKLVNGALKSKFNPTMSIFTLKNKYKWVDKNETDLTSKGESIVSLPEWLKNKPKTDSE